MVTVCPSQFATRRTLFHVLVGCGLLMLKVSRLKLPVIWLLVSMWLNTLTKSQIWSQRYHDVISSFGGKTSYDADNRPLLVMRSNLWASGYDVDGTDQTSLGQFSGRVQQTYKHSVPRFFVPE